MAEGLNAAVEAASKLTDQPSSGHIQPIGFGDRLADRVQRRRSQIVLGLDPDPARLWPEALELAGGTASGTRSHPPIAEQAARAVAAHCRLVLDAAADQCVAVKPQVACFERLGAPGWSALREVVQDAGQRGLVVIADAKRGDIDISARAYGQAFFGATPTPFGEVPGLGADALTVSPLLGRDSLAPLIAAAREQGGGLFALARTSNPGAADVQDRELAGGGTVSEAVAAMIDELGHPGIGEAGLSDVGAVTGATAPERLHALRALMPHAVWLLPGIGPQGGSGRDLAPAFAPGPAGGLVSASRAIVYAFERDGATGTPAACANDEAARLRELIWGLYA
ncbi:MAG TPA: orotidine-5'-phosphate decarboxylase [Solirubrobacteraceae bacterium]|nr:orotidine-5'-phosphate decarboxylase [Solirubrobacteraceae bacterium]